MPMIGARFYAQIDNLHVRGDILENELAKVSVHNLGGIRTQQIFKHARVCRNSIVLVCSV